MPIRPPIDEVTTILPNFCCRITGRPRAGCETRRQIGVDEVAAKFHR